jgi:hypothetical protein
MCLELSLRNHKVRNHNEELRVIMRPVLKWIKKDTRDKMDWINVAQNREKRWDVPYKAIRINYLIN